MKITIMMLCGLLLLPMNAMARPAAYDFGTHTPQNASIRSLVLPGWGQVFNGQEAKGYVVGTGFFLSALMSYYFYNKANATYSDYEKRGIKSDPLYSDYESQSNQAAVTSVLALGIWVYGIADAYFTGKSLLEMPASARRREGFIIAAGEENVAFVFRKTF